MLFNLQFPCRLLLLQGELVKDGVNGFTFTHRNCSSLEAAMRRVLENKEQAAFVGARGYLQSQDGQIPDIDHHVEQVLSLYMGRPLQTRAAEPAKQCSGTATFENPLPGP